MKNGKNEIINNDNYKSLVNEIKDKIRKSQLNASMKVNQELLSLYWHVGQLINERQTSYGWGDLFLTLISDELKIDFPNMKGFSPQNLKHIRYWYNFYKEVISDENVWEMIKSIPWGHNQRIMYRSKSVEEAIFYIKKTLDNGWSRSVLEHQIDSDLYQRKGKAITNFKNKLPESQSDLAVQMLKDPYSFDFLTLTENYNEKELEESLIGKITDFLLELGTGFSFIGRQEPLKVGDSHFYIDLLFYHVKLHCYVVIELKTVKFKPEFVGKLNFYVTAVNEQIKTDKDEPTIGILICKDKDEIVVEYSLTNVDQPIGVTQYEIKKVLDDKFKNGLPTIEEIEESLSND